MIFRPANWYWVVAGSQIYSSAVGDYVSSGDTNYQAWLASGGLPTRINSESELGDVLAASGATMSTSLVIQQKLRQAQLDTLLVANADMVKLIQAGQSSSLTGTGVANYLASATNNYRSLRSQIAAAVTASAVRAININAGWPNNP